MATANTFVPYVGSLAAPFAIVSGDGTTIPQSAIANSQGTPREGVLRWVLHLISPNTVTNDDHEFVITVPIPEAIPFDAAIAAAGINAVFPLLTLASTDAAIDAAFAKGVAVNDFDIANRTLEIIVNLQQVASAGSWDLVIDFCHSAVN